MTPASNLAMQVTAERIQQALALALVPTALDVIDESAAHAGHAGAGPEPFGTHFRVRISSPLFTNLSRVAQHRLVYDALRIFIDQGVHAIAIEAVPPVPPSAAATPAAKTTQP